MNNYYLINKDGSFLVFRSKQQQKERDLTHQKPNIQARNKKKKEKNDIKLNRPKRKPKKEGQQSEINLHGQSLHHTCNC